MSIRLIVMLFILPVVIPPAVGESGHGGDQGEMFLHEISGQRYERQTTSPDGSPTGRELIEVGRLRRRGDSVELPVDITVYEANGDVEKRLRSVWKCRADRGRMIMPVVFLLGKQDSTVRLTVRGDPILFPRRPTERLEDIELRVEPEAGLFSFLGGRSVVRITDRRVELAEAGSPPRYTISEKVELKVFALGIPFRTTRLDSQEVMDPGLGLISQTLRYSDGSRSVIRRLPRKTQRGGRRAALLPRQTHVPDLFRPGYEAQSEARTLGGKTLM